MEDVPKVVNLHEKRNGIKFRTDKNKKIYLYKKNNISIYNGTVHFKLGWI